MEHHGTVDDRICAQDHTQFDSIATVESIMKGADDGGVGSDPSDGILAASTDGSMIWNL
jgi:hypothetical protein